MFRKILFCVLLVVALIGLSGFAVAMVAPQQERVEQPLLIKGRGADGVMLMQNGVNQSVTCPSPQPYVTADGTSTGWACLDDATGMWQMNAKSETATDYTQQPVYQEPSTEYKYYSSPNWYPYPMPFPFPDYPYYYGAPFYWGAPSFRSGFGRPWP
jgi:hypothetical protein